MKLAEKDKEIFDLVRHEIEREEYSLILIASENYVDEEVLEAQGSVLTNKYAEGYPGKRYYGGCEYVDVAENLARDRAKKLFGAEYANVLVLGGRVIGKGLAEEIVKTWFQTKFEGGRHERRVEKIKAWEREHLR